MWEDYWTPYSGDTAWWGGGGGVDSWWDAPEFDGGVSFWDAGDNWGGSAWGADDYGGYGGGDAYGGYPELQPMSAPFGTVFRGAEMAGQAAQLEGPANMASNANPAAITASMQLGGGSNWSSGWADRPLLEMQGGAPGLRMPNGPSVGLHMPRSPGLDYMGGGTGLTAAGNTPIYGGGADGVQGGFDWSGRLGKMADSIVNQLPKMALSALTPKPKLPGGSGMDMMMASIQRNNAFNDRLASDYQANMPGIQGLAVNTMNQTSPQAQANEAYRAAMVSGAAGRSALERRLATSGASPDARLASMARYDTGAGANRAQAYNTGLGRGLTQTMGAATQAASLFPKPDYGASGAMAGNYATLSANRARAEDDIWRRNLSGISGMLGGTEEGRRRGMEPYSGGY